MLSSFVASVLAISAFTGPTWASPTKGSTAVDNCTSFPSWTIESFNSTTTDSTGTGGSASFVLTNDLTGASDELKCSLQVNYRCIISGTPTDKNVTINVAIRAGSLTILVEEVVEGCPGRTT
jgi:hypothetical protein